MKIWKRLYTAALSFVGWTKAGYGKACKEFFLQTLLPASLCHLLNAASGSRIKGYTEENL